MKIGFVSLGCSKNLVDTEKTIALFAEHGYNIVNNPKQADVIVINTCGFIEEAKEEAINTILEMAEYKQDNCKYIIVMGCLVERYKTELEKEIPEVDLWIKYSEYENLWDKVSKLLEKKTETISFENFQGRVITTGENYAYLKIADGCSNRCTYCAIPYIRGPQKSRKMEEIIAEAEQLANEGYREIILIAQDTTKYGTDIYGKPMLVELLQGLCKIDKVKWIRFLYAYPETITDELIHIVKEEEKICPYFDIPIQHISDRVLKRMNRQSNGESIRELIKKLRQQIPNVIIRTTVMVGFPGETQEDFDELYNFLEEAKFDKLGCFAYSKEEGTPAEKLPDQIHSRTKKDRYNKIMSLQQGISYSNLEKQKGRELTVLLEGKTFDGQYIIGRSYMDVPDIDGVIYIKNKEESSWREGQFVNVQIQEVQKYDLIGEIVSEM